MMSRNVTFMSCMLTAALWLGGTFSFAGPADVKVELPNLRTIQSVRTPQPLRATDDANKADEVYLLVTGVAKGEAVAKQLPDGKTWKSSPKTPAVDAKSAVTIWEGKLEEGQFVALTVAAFAGKNEEAKRKEYFEKKAASDKKALAADIKDKAALDAVRKDLNKANVAFFKAIGELYPKGKADDYLGAYDVIIANVGGTIHKRVVPTGLLHGEHYGTGVKQYTKIKYTRENVLTKDSSGQFYEQQMEPLGENEESVRIKMTEVEKTGDKRAVTDYLTDVKILVGGKALKFVLAGDKPGPTIVHDYWEWVE